MPSSAATAFVKSDCTFAVFHPFGKLRQKGWSVKGECYFHHMFLLIPPHGVPKVVGPIKFEDGIKIFRLDPPCGGNNIPRKVKLRKGGWRRLKGAISQNFSKNPASHMEKEQSMIY
jgi:hypothetical protein